MRISTTNTNSRASVKHNHARNMKTSKTQHMNNYLSTPHIKAPQLKQYASGSAKIITRQMAHNEKTKMTMMDKQRVE